MAGKVRGEVREMDVRMADTIPYEPQRRSRRSRFTVLARLFMLVLLALLIAGRVQRYYVVWEWNSTAYGWPAVRFCDIVVNSGYLVICPYGRESPSSRLATGLDFGVARYPLESASDLGLTHVPFLDVAFGQHRLSGDASSYVAYLLVIPDWILFVGLTAYLLIPVVRRRRGSPKVLDA